LGSGNALRHASRPTMLGGSLASSASRAKRLNFLRRTTLPDVSKPTMWKTSLPISMPMEAKVCVGWP
jgi:hypothetical protein